MDIQDQPAPQARISPGSVLIGAAAIALWLLPPPPADAAPNGKHVMAQELTKTEQERDRIDDPHATYYGLLILGDIATANGDSAIAEQHYQEAANVLRKLAARDPANAQWQTDLVASHGKIGLLGGPKACGHFQEALANLKRLDSENKLTADQKGWIALTEAKISETC